MKVPYFPHTDEDIRLMLERIGAGSLRELYSDVPEDFIFKGDYDLPDSMSETEVRNYFANLEKMNVPLVCFAGGGAYDHYSPAVIDYIISRSEFLTAYTPYQSEISQGTLRYIFEYQSMISSLTGMDCANASMYDGPTSAAEAAMMAVSASKKRNRILLSETLLPQVKDVVKTYAFYHGLELGYIPAENGNTCLDALADALADGDVAGVIVPEINRFGIIEDLNGFADAVHEKKTLLIVYADPSSLAVLKSPGSWGADIACGEAQTLGLPLSFGGPYIGYLACRKELVRKLPGRIVGATEDADGKMAFVLTLQAREQHIRREKATSNICSNQSLMALYVSVYMSLMGKDGLKRVNELSYGGAHYLYKELLATGLFEPVFDRPFLKEFVLKPLVPADELRAALADAGFFGALGTEEGYVSFCVTEKRTKEEIDSMVNVIKSIK